jgi:hypothetical protein
MNLEQSKEMSTNLSYEQAIWNCLNAKGVQYRQATKMKLAELLSLAKILDTNLSDEELINYLKTIRESDVLDKTTGSDSNEYISAHYIQEKMRPIQNLIRIVGQECSIGELDNIADKIPENQRQEFAFACAIICKELDVSIPDV